MLGNQIDLKSIQDLRGMKFFIPDYQRGYRWTKQQVGDLLDDIWEFMNNGNGGWYSLQPVVVKKIDPVDESESFLEQLKEIANHSNEKLAMTETSKLINKFNHHKYWEVVDGQQRLTSLFIVLKYLNKDTKNTNHFTIEYETRSNSKIFLNNIVYEVENEAGGNIDYYHMYQTYKAIEEWFVKTKRELTNEIKEKYNENLEDEFKKIFSIRLKLSGTK